jgi:hypothetical protein
LQKIERFGGDEFSADFVAGEAAAFEEQDAGAGAGGGDGGGASGRSSADDY